LAFASFSGEVVRFAGGFAGLDWVFVLETNRFEVVCQVGRHLVYEREPQ